MTVDAERMRANLELTHGALFSQRVLLALVAGRARRATTPTASSRSSPSARGTRARRCASCSPPTSAPRASTSTRSSTLGHYIRHAARDRRAARRDRLSASPPPPLVASRHVTTLADLPLIASGKVREMYDLGRPQLLMVASDRISTYDAVHPTPIPDKGKVLTGLSVFWFEQTGAHRRQPPHLGDRRRARRGPRPRARRAASCEMLPVECVVRGYITGSGWKDYQATGTVSGIELPAGPAGVRAAARADLHALDEGRGRPRRDDRLRARRRARRRPRADGARRATSSIELYSFAAEHARERGVILADTKFEFGLDADGELRVGDEVLTPDSSRYWPADGYEVGRGQPSFDKQYVRDWASRQRLGQDAAGAGDPRRRRRRHARALRRGLRADHRRAVRRLARRGPAPREGARADPPEGGHPRPAGRRRRARAAGARLRRASRTSTSAGSSSSTSRTRRSCEPMCEKLLANPLVEDYEISLDAHADAP